MKRTAMIIGLAALILTGCSWELAETERAQNVNRAEAAALPAPEWKEAPPYYEGHPVNPQVTDDRLLQQPGGMVLDERGEAELLKAGEGKRVTAGPVELTVHEAKLFHYHPAEELIGFYHTFTDEMGFPVAKLFIEVTNTGNHPLRFTPAAVLETDTDERKLWKDDIYLEALGDEIGAGETKKGSVGFILDSGSAERLTVRTGEVADRSGETLAGGTEFDIPLE
ncbi:hypothetical protein [Bhargavaea beijingensis]|uniref:DUF4352 domain-containing protein n=1 Tax=Bhargavaea beijingensis TaxID=426756 RepID=A0ABX9ZD41_9BACL|nr:hypothetical protein [Bhargavaea beijingensis]RSK31937.1 hypothetical protein EJA12_08100 [Bhargavaea beijingensis]